jgi:hypothetical protein
MVFLKSNDTNLIARSSFVRTWMPVRKKKIQLKFTFKKYYILNLEMELQKSNTKNANSFFEVGRCSQGTQ